MASLVTVTRKGLVNKVAIMKIDNTLPACLCLSGHRRDGVNASQPQMFWSVDDDEKKREVNSTAFLTGKRGTLHKHTHLVGGFEPTTTERTLKSEATLA